LLLLVFCCGENRTFLSSDDYWLGLRRAEGVYEWNDDNPSTYRNWSSGEPDQNTQCIIYTIDGFKDTGCFSTAYYTCKKAAGNFHANCLRKQQCVSLRLPPGSGAQYCDEHVCLSVHCSVRSRKLSEGTSSCKNALFEPLCIKSPQNCDL